MCGKQSGPNGTGASGPAAGPPGNPARSVAWRIHRERIVVLGWGRAILLQFAHPLVAAGVAAHSPFRSEPWGRLRRLRRTVDAMLGLTFGTPGEAAAVAQTIRSVHEQVHGRLPAPAGVFPTGTPYSAEDPALLRWVQNTLTDSHLLTYALFVGPLTPEEEDRYCAEVARMGPCLGIPEGSLPAHAAGLRQDMEAMLTRGQIVVSDTARMLARELLYPPTLGVAGPLAALMRLVTLGLLPPPIRAAYGFSWNARQERALRLSARSLRGLLPFVPSRLRYWGIARAALREARQSPLLRSKIS
jgi:uncharacterized protein (DUF2236 family)